jgi:hypothetical protein
LPHPLSVCVFSFLLHVQQHYFLLFFFFFAASPTVSCFTVPHTVEDTASPRLETLRRFLLLCSLFIGVVLTFFPFRSLPSLSHVSCALTHPLRSPISVAWAFAIRVLRTAVQRKKKKEPKCERHQQRKASQFVLFTMLQMVQHTAVCVACGDTHHVYYYYYYFGNAVQSNLLVCRCGPFLIYCLQYSPCPLLCTSVFLFSPPSRYWAHCF